MSEFEQTPSEQRNFLKAVGCSPEKIKTKQYKQLYEIPFSLPFTLITCNERAIIGL